MPDHPSRAELYRRQMEECVMMAQASTSNKIRSDHYAKAEQYRNLLGAETNLTASYIAAELYLEVFAAEARLAAGGRKVRL
jgi:uncharacterized protein with von Willebrand factor type A (vWA) domain